MGTTPGGGTENDLDLLSTGETPHGVVGDELGLETEVGEVLLDLTTDEGSEETSTLGLTGVDLEDFLQEESHVRPVSKEEMDSVDNVPSRNHA